VFGRVDPSAKDRPHGAELAGPPSEVLPHSPTTRRYVADPLNPVGEFPPARRVAEVIAAQNVAGLIGSRSIERVCIDKRRHPHLFASKIRHAAHRLLLHHRRGVKVVLVGANRIWSDQPAQIHRPRRGHQRSKGKRCKHASGCGLGAHTLCVAIFRSNS